MTEENAGSVAGGDGKNSTETGSSKARKPKSRGKAEAPAAAEQPSASSSQAPTPTDMLGQIAWLMVQSASHKHLFLTDLEWLAMPAIILKQFRIWRQGPQPIAYASWALLTEDAEQRLLSGQRRLRPGEWNAGDRLWLIDLVAPFGGADGFLTDFKRKVFPDREIKTLVPGPDGKGFRAATISAAAPPGQAKEIKGGEQ